MKIRHALPSDAEAIGEVRVRAWRAAYVPYMPARFLAELDPHANLDSLRSKLPTAGPDFQLKVIEHAATVAGFSILGKPRYAAPDGTHELWALNVDPTSWRLGMGRRLVSQALLDAQALGATQVQLWCIAGNQPARALYESLGFKATGDERITSHLTGHPLCEVLYEAGCLGIADGGAETPQR